MRAKYFLAAALLLTVIQPVFADDLVRDVHETLYRPVHHGLLGGLFGGLLGGRRCGVMTQPAVVAAPVCANSCAIETQPAVLAPASCGTAILMRDPSDLDIRREQLAARINCLSTGCNNATLNAALSEVNQAELCMRSKGELTNLEARRLYRAMDRIGSHADRWSHTGFGLGAWIGLGPGVWY
ncbi:MAG TPA: hypothetical protein V6D22_01065 [Candidatus Obscuribacterales bacterium]